MRSISEKTAIKNGIVLGILCCLVVILFSCFKHWILLNGECFITKGETKDVVNGVYRNVIDISGFVLAIIIPTIFIRYSLFKYILYNITTGMFVYMILGVSVFCSMMLFPIEVVTNFWFTAINSFDFIIDYLFVFPIGYGIGVIVAIIINTILNKKQNN